jgi:hypothetical protein
MEDKAFMIGHHSFGGLLLCSLWVLAAGLFTSPSAFARETHISREESTGTAGAGCADGPGHFGTQTAIGVWRSARSIKTRPGVSQRRWGCSE